MNGCSTSDWLVLSLSPTSVNLTQFCLFSKLWTNFEVREKIWDRPIRRITTSFLLTQSLKLNQSITIIYVTVLTYFRSAIKLLSVVVQLTFIFGNEVKAN